MTPVVSRINRRAIATGARDNEPVLYPMRSSAVSSRGLLQEAPSKPGGVCALGPTGYAELQRWATGLTAVDDTGKNKYAYWLPSLNLKFGIANDLIFRLAASKDYARPQLADIRNFLKIGISSSGNASSTAGNPFLKPITSDNFDATLEWYFAGNRLGSLTFDVLPQRTSIIISIENTLARDITSNGVTETVFVRGPANFHGTGKVRGFEIAYNQVLRLPSGFAQRLRSQRELYAT